MAEQMCPICRRGTLQRKSLDYETLVDNGRGVIKQLRVPGVFADVCGKCGEAFFDPATQNRIIGEQRKALGLLSAAEIRGLRGKKTQAEMCELLGIGQKTYCRWESEGHFQSEAFDRFLRMLMMSEANWQILERIAKSKRKGGSGGSGTTT
jgi:YgiT-type zinc finger domain-containing protein